jgi:hypothetical protein
MKKTSGLLVKQAHYFCRVEQPMPFKKLVVQFLICGKHITGQSIRGLRDSHGPG